MNDYFIKEMYNSIFIALNNNTFKFYELTFNAVPAIQVLKAWFVYTNALSLTCQKASSSFALYNAAESVWW